MAAIQPVKAAPCPDPLYPDVDPYMLAYCRELMIEINDRPEIRIPILFAVERRMALEEEPGKPDETLNEGETDRSCLTSAQPPQVLYHRHATARQASAQAQKAEDPTQKDLNFPKIAAFCDDLIVDIGEGHPEVHAVILNALESLRRKAQLGGDWDA
jgi:hypothetical protein